MVLVFQRDSCNRADITDLCKMMVNMENNMTIFKKNGLLNKVKPLEPFNVYKYKEVSYTADITHGIILIYSDTINVTNLIQDIKTEIQNFDVIKKKKMPIDLCDHKSTQYTLVTTEIDSKVPYKRQFIYGNIKHDLSANFIWEFIKPCNCLSYMSIVEYSRESVYPSSVYLNASLCTIIYDNTNAFNLKNYTKQINYPSLKQYNLFKEKKLLDVHINIDSYTGIDEEIISYFTPQSYKYALPYIKQLKVVDYKQYNIRRVNPLKKWNIQIKEIFNYEKQEQMELDIKETGKPPFLNDICFITHTPLYKNTILLEIGEPDGELYKNKFHIMIHPYVYERIINNYTLGFKSFFESICNLKVINEYITKYPRKEYEVIDMIPDNKINSDKKDIMMCLSKNGGYNSKYVRYHRPKLYTFNKEKNIIYVGLSNINAYDAIEYRNTNSILFHMNIT
jgi:hypothetical protein